MVEHLVVKEQLAVKELHAGILLYLHELNVTGQVIGLRMLLGVACTGQSELSVELALYVRCQIAGVFEV